MQNNFGPLPWTTSPYYSGSSSQSVLNPSLFYNSWSAQGTNANGQNAAAEYTMHHPSGGIAYFHMLLDASGSTWKKVSTGDRKQVYEYLLKNFVDLVECGDTLLPNDVIYVWTFNKRTKLLCRVERKNFHANLETIKDKYKKEFGEEEGNYKETRLYDAIATVMVRIRKEYEAHKKADFFLVPFTDGVDYRSENTSLYDMMDSINGFGGRLHTIFITVNMPPDSELYKRLESQKKEITLINCEKTEPNEIRMAFNTLRQYIKFFLVVIHQNGSELQMQTRIAGYGANEQDVAETMMTTLQSRGASNMLDGWYQWKSLQGRPPP